MDITESFKDNLPTLESKFSIVQGDEAHKMLFLHQNEHDLGRYAITIKGISPVEKKEGETEVKEEKKEAVEDEEFHFKTNVVIELKTTIKKYQQLIGKALGYEG